MSHKHIETVILDAGPLITQPAATLQQYANKYFTTPGVFSELKDETVRQQLTIWGSALEIKQPKQEYIDKVITFAKLTGDYSVLSVNDIHIIALAYEFEIINGGILRSFPGEKLGNEDNDLNKDQSPVNKNDDGFSVVRKGRKRGGKRQREKREAELKKLQEEAEKNQEQDEVNEVQDQSDEITQVEVREEKPEVDGEKDAESSAITTPEQSEVNEEFNESDDDGEWITPENLQEEIIKDQHETIQDTTNSGPTIKVALATGDFACQNVAMQLGIKLLNTMSGKQIKRVRNYMYRCHACFRLTPINKDGKPKHFCPKCGGDTLIRCAVSVDNKTGKTIPHLKQNFQWIKRGEKYSLPSPLSKNQQKLQGKGGYQHNIQNRHKSQQNPLILREDQKEYQQALKNDDWERRQNEKLLQNWIGGGSADNYVSPFGTVNTIRPSGVRVGKGRYVNSSKGKK
ncbi:nob1 [Candida pseudojiufengensis]|uniref:nob1 n=1 Tax=Candida pseudojiufengensis TaxID=497109 RepID=UPI002225A3B5|nr:nob1 [Candida pseudojiufengensis]KAI5961599.1 nob1 [Candida pseudojiufengensis]